ncbi:MAG TPA: c-type cytochrome [Gemmatimonadaceae bacterium]|jgi:cytochrome c oxidase cbb3-type subunit 3
MRRAPNVVASLAVAAALLAAACKPEQGASANASVTSASSGGMDYHITPTASNGVRPGIHPSVVFGEIRNPYAGNAAAATEGRQLFVQYNCSGCHGGRAGGAMGPSLRDSLWIYGNSDPQLFGTIVEGRSAGMPAWGGRIPPDQIWKLITYIRTLGTPAEPDAPPPESDVPIPK